MQDTFRTVEMEACLLSGSGESSGISWVAVPPRRAVRSSGSAIVMYE